MKTEWNEGYEKGYADALEWDKREKLAKELTDEEMLECAESAGCVFDYSYKGEVTFISKNALKRFVLAILRKAQEK